MRDAAPMGERHLRYLPTRWHLPDMYGAAYETGSTCVGCVHARAPSHRHEMAAVPTKERAPDLPVEPQDRKLMIVSGTLEGEAREHPVSEPLIGLNYHELAVGASRDDTLIRCCRLFGRRCSVTQERGLALIGCTKGPRAGVENQN
jgi:hypothetical protein